MSEKEPFELGWVAGVEGVDPRLCPFDKMTREWREWQGFHGKAVEWCRTRNSKTLAGVTYVRKRIWRWQASEYRADGYKFEFYTNLWGWLRPVAVRYSGEQTGVLRQGDPNGHLWRYCEHCEREMVVCGKCGNNSCNGGYGTLSDGSECGACPSAYEMQDRGR